MQPNGRVQITAPSARISLARISDLHDDEVKVGIRLWNASHDKLGTIVIIDLPPADRYQSAWIRWDESHRWALHSNFWENQSELEIFRMLDDDQCNAIKLWYQGFKRQGAATTYADLTLPEFVFKITGKKMEDQIHAFNRQDERYVVYTKCDMRIDWWDAIGQRLTPHVVEYKADAPYDDRCFLTGDPTFVTCSTCKVRP